MVENYSKNQIRYMHILLAKYKIELSFNIEKKEILDLLILSQCLLNLTKFN